MTYEEFVRQWSEALRASGLPIFGVGAEEKLDLHSLDRSYEIRLEPVGGQDAEPFTVAARLGWRWTALHTARSTRREEEVLTELHGRDGAIELETVPPWLRVDIVLSAALPWGQTRPMPPREIWGRWVSEVRERFEGLEPLLPEETSRINDEGLVEVLGWQGLPEVEVELTAEGEPRYGRLRLAAFQILHLPRHFDDPSREDEGPHGPLREMLARVKKALHTWTECLDLLPGPKADTHRR